MLMRFDPFRELDRLTEAATSRPRTGPVPMDAYRRGDRFLVHLDLPGLDASDIDLEIEKNMLTVSAERRWEPEEGDDIVVSERLQGRFSRQLFLSEALDSEKIEARYEAGVLTLTIPVAEQAKPRRIEVSPGGGGQVVEATGSER
jgi:HSP20 family protein